MTKRIQRDAEGKDCTKCGTYKIFNEFYRLKRSADGRQSWCKACMIQHMSSRASLQRAAEREAAELADEPQTGRDRLRKATRLGVAPAVLHMSYVSTPEHESHIRSIMACECCGTPLGTARGTRAHDHDYLTGTLRGALCFSCNTGIGKLGDTLGGLEQAETYLCKRLDVLALAEHLGQARPTI